MKKGKTIADLRAIHDKSVVIPNRIRTAIANLAASGDEYAYEAEFSQLSKPPIASIDIAKWRDQFQDFWAEMPSTKKSRPVKVWFATKKLADEWKEAVGG